MERGNLKNAVCRHLFWLMASASCESVVNFPRADCIYLWLDFLLILKLNYSRNFSFSSTCLLAPHRSTLSAVGRSLGFHNGLSRFTACITTWHFMFWFWFQIKTRSQFWYYTRKTNNWVYWRWIQATKTWWVLTESDHCSRIVASTEFFM